MNANLQIVEKLIAPASVACPICSGGKVHPVTQHKEKSLQRCGDCGVTFLFPQPSSEDVAAHFQDSPALAKDELQQKFVNNRARVLARVAREIQSRRQPGSVLDVGCATGLFLGRYFSADWDRWGIDLSPSAARQAALAGIEAHCGDLRVADFDEDRFDLVTILDAFYYFPSPKEELAEIRRILKDDGLLALELPLATSRIWRGSNSLGRLLSKRGQPLLASSDHLFYFTPAAVSGLLQRAGFKVEAVVPLPGNRQPGFLRDLMMRSYFGLAVALEKLTRSRVFLAPRFLVLASKANAK